MRGRAIGGHRLHVGLTSRAGQVGALRWRPPLCHQAFPRRAPGWQAHADGPPRTSPNCARTKLGRLQGAKAAMLSGLLHPHDPASIRKRRRPCPEPGPFLGLLGHAWAVSAGAIGGLQRSPWARGAVEDS